MFRSVLVTNDDGIVAPGLWTLVRAVRHLADRVYVVSPSMNKSAIGAGITLHERLDWFPVEDPEVAGVEAWHVDGTPGDCVTIAFDRILDHKPDLVVSGLNHGSNLGYEVLQSGTVAGAIYGYMRKVPAIAFSHYVAADLDVDWRAAERQVRRALDAITPTLGDEPVLLSVNLPHNALGLVRGMLVTHMGQYGYATLRDVSDRATVLARQDAALNTDPFAPPGSDLWALLHDYISVTPLQAILTDYRLVERLGPVLNTTFQERPAPGSDEIAPPTKDA